MNDENVFHAHLDKCKQCANNPFKLCPIGQNALVEESTKALAAAEKRAEVAEAERDALAKQVGIALEALECVHEDHPTTSMMRAGQALAAIAAVKV